jgi:hypothetical protein
VDEFLLLLRGRLALFALDFLEELDNVEVFSEPGFEAALAQGIVGRDAVV